jgi:hypothetical protein
MIYFTIPANVLGTGNPVADTDVYLDNGIQFQNNPAIREVLFGEDYSLTIPLGSRRRSFSASMSNRSQADADLIDGYFSYLEGEPINNFRILDAAATVVVLQWSKVFRSADVYSVQGSFKEVVR